MGKGLGQDGIHGLAQIVQPVMGRDADAQGKGGLRRHSADDGSSLPAFVCIVLPA